LSEQPVPETRGPLRDRLERAAPWSPIWPCSRWGLPCLVDYSSSGGLLPHLFTLTAKHNALAAVYFLWHCPSKRLAAFLPRVSQPGRVTRHRALWSSDFPPRDASAPKRFSALPKSAPRVYHARQDRTMAEVLPRWLCTPVGSAIQKGASQRDAPTFSIRKKQR